MGLFKVTAALLLTKHFPYNRKDATNATSMTPKYEVNHITARASLIYGQKVLTARYSVDLNVKVVCMKVGLFINYDDIIDVCRFRNIFVTSKKNGQR